MLEDRSPLQHFPLLLSFPLCRQRAAGGWLQGGRRSQPSTVCCYHHTSADQGQGDHGAASYTTHITPSAMLGGTPVWVSTLYCDYVRHVLVGEWDVTPYSDVVVALPNTCYDLWSTLPPWSRWGWSTGVLKYTEGQRVSKHQILLWQYALCVCALCPRFLFFHKKNDVCYNSNVLYCQYAQVKI